MHLVEGQDAMTSLTDAFIVARYSTHPVTPSDSAAQQANATQVLRELQKPDELSVDENADSGGRRRRDPHLTECCRTAGIPARSAALTTA